MKEVSVDEFVDYIKSHNTFYVYNPRVDLAYKSVTTKEGREQVFVKHHGAFETQIPYDDDDYCQSWFMTTIMTKEEYENF